MSEKLKTQQRHNELEKLSHELEMKVLSQAEHQAPDSRCPHTVLNCAATLNGTVIRNEVCYNAKVRLSPPICSRFKMLESELESSLKRSLQIKEDKMAALEARLQESSTLNQQLRQELRTVSHQACREKNNAIRGTLL